MDKEKILLSGSPVEIAEFGDYKMATFLISVLDEYDLNGRMIPKESGELYHSTMVGFPILAKMVCDAAGDPVDFAGHEMYMVKDEDGNMQVRFNTHPIGSVVETWIEDRDVAGYLGQKSCIMIKAKLWSSRYPEYFEVLDKLWKTNNVKSSWELTVQEAVQTAKGRILKAFSFIGNTLLGSNVLGAVPGAGVYEYAQADHELELATALSKDICRSDGAQRKEDERLENEIVMDNQTAKTEEVVSEQVEAVEEVIAEQEPAVTTEEVVAEAEETSAEETTEEVVAEVEQEEEVVEQAALTEYDLRRKVNEAYRAYADKWGWVCFWFPAENEAWIEYEGRPSELDYMKVTYTVENDVVTINEVTPVKLTVAAAEINDAIASRDEAIVKANDKINDLTAQIAALQPYKDAADKAEQERIEAELAEKRERFKAKMLQTKLFEASELESSEKLCSMIERLDEAELKAEIAERFMSNLDKEQPAVTETASVETASRTVVERGANYDNKEFMRHFMARN